MAVWHGQFNDGRTAQNHVVQVLLAGHSLLVQTPAGERLARWELHGARLCEDVYAGGPVRIQHRDMPDARLSVPDAGFLEALGAQLPRFRRRRVRGPVAGRIALWGALLLLLLASLIWSAPRLAGPIAALIPAPWEEALGRHVVATLAPAGQQCTDADAQAALDQLVQTLSAGAALPYRFDVRLVARDEVNAFAAPGGHIVLFSGLVEFADSGEEVAGVLAHEISHILLRHPTEGLVRSVGLKLVLAAALGDFAALGAAAGDFGLTLLNLAYSRDAERAADALAVELLGAAGIDSRGLGRFFARLEAETERPEAPGLLSTHPLPASRSAAIEASARPGQAAFSPDAWHALRQACVTAAAGPEAPNRDDPSDT